jgi:hypothetical protein
MPKDQLDSPCDYKAPNVDMRLNNPQNQFRNLHTSGKDQTDSPLMDSISNSNISGKGHLVTGSRGNQLDSPLKDDITKK